MQKLVNFDFWEIDPVDKLVEFGEMVILKCFEVEKMMDKKLLVNIVFTNSNEIRKINKEHRNIDKSTDVLSFPIFYKEELLARTSSEEIDILGDIIISIEQVEIQAKEYEHSFKRELAYMIVHGFYHLIGFDHIQEQDKAQMREKEELILNNLEISRN